MNVWRYLPPLMDPTANPLTTDAAIERMKNFRRFILISIGVVILNYLDGNMVRWKKKHATTTSRKSAIISIHLVVAGRLRRINRSA